MPTTLLRRSDGKNILFLTQDVEDRIVLYVRVVDDDLKVIESTPVLELLLDTHENFHTKLRDAAAKVGALITSMSTDPEWNPKDYRKTLEGF